MRKIFFSTLFLVCLTIHAQTLDTDLFSPKGVAEIRIVLDDGKTFNDINDQTKLPATFQALNANGSTYETYELYNGKAKLEFRGFSSQGVDQKSYSLHLVLPNGEDNPQNMLGMPADEEWALIAAYPDKSRLRVPLAYKLGELINTEWSPRTRFAELYLNGDYLGLYIVCENVKRADRRINIKKLNFESETDKISGGYIVEVIPYERKDREDTVFYTNRGLGFTNKYPKSKNISMAQIAWIKNHLNEFEGVLYGSNYTDPTNGWRKYLDENSVMNYCLVNELSKNTDARMYASVFFYKDRNGILKMGPLWDFDIAFGNVNYGDCCIKEEGYHMIYGRWLERIFSDEAFKAKYRQRYDEVKPVFDRIPEIIRKNAEQLVASGAIDRNFQKWQILGIYVWPNNAPYPQTYEGEVQRLTDWTRARNSWLNINLFTTKEEACEKLQTEKIPLWSYETDNFWAEKPTVLYTLRGYDSYIWNDGTPTANYKTNIATDNVYYVKVKKDNCWSVLSDTIVYGSPILPPPIPNAIQNIGNENLSIYADNNLIITANGEEYMVSIYDIIGNKQAQFALRKECTLLLPKGVYVIVAQSQKERIVRKVLLH